MPLNISEEAQRRRYAAYTKMIQAMNEAGLDDAEKFSLAGCVFTQVVERLEADRDFKHAAVDEFAKTCHQLIDAH